MKITAKEIAKLIDGEIIGNENIIGTNFARIEDAKEGDICFIANQKYSNYVTRNKASIIIVNKNFSLNTTSTLIYVEDPYASFSQLLNFKKKKRIEKKGISQTCEISKNSIIGKNVLIESFTTIADFAEISNNVKIMPNCYIGENVKIGKNTIVHPGVVVYKDSIIGKNNIIHAGSVIGADGFGFAPKNKKYSKIEQIGNVVIEDNVEIGANCAIDRATMGSTVIKKGVKLDNLIQIAHNVEIGTNTVIAAHVAIAGSTKIGANCMIGGNSSIAGHLKIGNNVRVAGQSGIGSNIYDNQTVQGPYAFNLKDFQRSYVIFKKLPDIYKKLFGRKNV